MWKKKKEIRIGPMCNLCSKNRDREKLNKGNYGHFLIVRPLKTDWERVCHVCVGEYLRWNLPQMRLPMYNPFLKWYYITLDYREVWRQRWELCQKDTFGTLMANSSKRHLIYIAFDVVFSRRVLAVVNLMINRWVRFTNKQLVCHTYVNNWLWDRLSLNTIGTFTVRRNKTHHILWYACTYTRVHRHCTQTHVLGQWYS